MNSFIESLNVWGGRIWDFALPMFWQSGVLIVVVLAFDFMLRRKIRAAVRYSLWFVVFLKLLLPPTLALPTGAAWWLRGRPAPVAAPRVQSITVNYSEPVNAFVPPVVPMVYVAPPAPKLTRDGWLLVIAAGVSVLLGAWVGFRWRYIARCVSGTTAADADVSAILEQARRLAGVRRAVRLRVTAQAMSPAVCGLFRPVILLPQSLIEKLTQNQLRAVLLHELIHLQRRDVWVNCAQTLLQIFYWWHPLLWVANARVRQVREEAVDDAVMFALSDEAEVYAPTLLEVAKLAFGRPLASLGLVGILESRNALRHRIERLLNSTAPRRAGVSVMSVICLAAFTALAVPMGEPPARPAAATNEVGAEKLIQYHAKVNSDVFTRNLQARAEGTMHTTNDDLNAILATIVDGFGVDCAGERAVTFNAAAGEVTAQNTSEQLGTLDEVVRELNLAGGEHILNPPHGLQQVLIEAQLYLIRPDDFQKLGLDSGRMHREDQMSPWWDVSAAELGDLWQRIRELGAESISSPRIQTSHGISANLFIGDGTNNIALDCLPLIHDGLVNLTALASTTGKYAPNGKGWPDLAGHKNCAIFSRMGIPDGAGVVLRADNVGTTTDNELIVVLRAKTIGAKDKVPFLGDLPRVGHLFRSPSNSTSLSTNLSTQPIQSYEAVAQLVQDGKVLYQLGKLDEADVKLNEALAKDPKNQAALYYLSLIKQARTRAMVDENGKRGAQNVPGPGGQEASPPLYRTNTIYTSPQRQKIYQKLNNIVFDKVSYPDLPLSDVVRDLRDQAQRRDPDQEGVSFILNRARPATTSGGLPLTGFDPRTGQPIVPDASPKEDVDLATVKVRLEPGLTKVRLVDVLEAITKTADHPINYSIVDYGIEFTFKGAEQVQLHTRTFKVDPNTFYRGLQGVGVLNSSNVAPRVSATINTNNGGSPARGLRYVSGHESTTEINLAIIGFFNAIGVNLAAPKSIFFNDRQDTLTVRATDADLELIEQAINTLNIAPPEVTIKVRFVEVDEGFLPNVLTNSSATGTNSLQTGILTDPAFRNVLKALEKRDHATLLSEGEVTTLSGRQAEFQTVDIQTFVSDVTATVTNKATTYQYKTTEMPFGSTLDVVPVVAADGYTIQMDVTPTVTEFLGYDNPKDYVKYDERLKHVQLPLPKYRSRQAKTSVIVWDGQTLVLGNLSDDAVVRKPDGATIQQPFSDKKKKRLVVFITPTIIDASGNRVHSDEARSKDYYDDPHPRSGGQ